RRRCAPVLTPFPYTTLFRSADEPVVVGVNLVEFLTGAEELTERNVAVAVAVHPLEPKRAFPGNRTGGGVKVKDVKSAGVVRLPRSEEHTSELQSRGHLVCRL